MDPLAQYKLYPPPTKVTKPASYGERWPSQAFTMQILYRLFASYGLCGKYTSFWEFGLSSLGALAASPPLMLDSANTLARTDLIFQLNLQEKHRETPAGRGIAGSTLQGQDNCCFSCNFAPYQGAAKMALQHKN